MAKPLKETSDLKDLHVKDELEGVSELEFEEMLFENTSDIPQRAINLPIIAGFGLVGVVAFYLLQQIGILPWANLQNFFIVFPLIGLFLILLFGLSPKKRKRRNRAARKARKLKLKKVETEVSMKDFVSSAPTKKLKWNLPKKSSKKLIAGVCGGLAQSINMDPNLFRLLFLIALIATAGSVPIAAYIFFAIFMPLPDDEAQPGE